MPSMPSAVVFVSPDFPPAFGGIQRVTERLAQVAHELGVRVAVVAAKSEGYASYDASLPFEVLRYDTGSLRRTILPMAALIRRAAKSIAAQRVVALLWSPPGLATTVLRYGGLRTPVTVLAHGTDIAKQNSLLRRFALRVVLSGTDVVANSSFTAGLLAQRGIIGVRIVNPGADPVESRDLPRATVPTVLTAGRLVRRKGYDRVIEAAQRLLPQFPELRVIVVGDGPDRSRLEQLASELGVGAHVEFRGRVDDAELAACYSRAWCFAMPNRNENHDVEGFGLVFLEAALHGVPSVGGRGSGADDAIVDGVTGFLVDGNDTGAVTGALEKLLADPVRAAAFGQAGRERALRDFTWERYTREMLDV